MAKKPKPRNQRITVLINSDERKQLDAAAVDKGISRADVLRESIRNYPVPGTRRDA
jgi:hypothetical protein